MIERMSDVHCIVYDGLNVLIVIEANCVYCDNSVHSLSTLAKYTLLGYVS